MRVAIISDIHGNCAGLDTVLSDLQSESVDQIVCLGDVATDGPQPRQVLARLKSIDCPVVMGNMDEWILDPPPRTGKPRPIKDIQYWGAAQLTSADRDYMRTFQATVAMSLEAAMGLICYHGSPQSNEQGIGYSTTNEDLQQMLADHRATVYAGGHTHRQMHRRYGDSIVLNPGTVGAPMPGKDSEPGPDPEAHPMWAEYAIVESRNGALRNELRRIPIDVDLLVESVSKSGMPNPEWWLAARYGYAVA